MESQATAMSPSAKPKVAKKHAIDLFRERVALSGGRTVLKWKEGGVWRESSWNDWDLTSREIAAGLISLGIGGGERCCLLANTRPEWVYCDVAILMAGGITVPIYQSN